MLPRPPGLLPALSQPGPSALSQQLLQRIAALLQLLFCALQQASSALGARRHAWGWVFMAFFHLYF